MGGGGHITEVAFAFTDPAAPGSNPSWRGNDVDEFIDSALYIQWNVNMLYKVDQTHLVLASIASYNYKKL